MSDKERMSDYVGERGGNESTATSGRTHARQKHWTPSQRFGISIAAGQRALVVGLTIFFLVNVVDRGARSSSARMVKPREQFVLFWIAGSESGSPTKTRSDVTTDFCGHDARKNRW